MVESVLAVAAILLFFSWRSACKSHSEVFFKPISSTTNSQAKVLYLPEDAVLRRHFLAQLNSEIEAALPPCPADSVLRRHHQALVAERLQQRLALLSILHRC